MAESAPPAPPAPPASPTPPPSHPPAGGGSSESSGSGDGGAGGGRRDLTAGAPSSETFFALAPEADDEALLSRLASGKGRETALPELFRRHGADALRLATRLLGDWQVAEEAVQDAFLRLAEKAPLWRGEAGFRTFFTRLLINVCRNRRRLGRDALSRGRRVGSPSALLGGVAASTRITEVARGLEAEEVRRAVRAAIERLPEKYREALVLRELEGLGYKEIAAVLEVSLDEIRSWIFRGRQHLRGLLEGRQESL